MSIKHIIFDLDGTLINSAPSILTTFADALKIHKIQPKISLHSSIIGPPMHEMFKKLTGYQDSARLDPLTDTYKLQYDSVGYKSTEIFPGVEDLLKELVCQKFPIYIATNKRLNPTILILEHLGWTSYFEGVYALDCIDPPHKNKAKMLAHSLQYIGEAPQHIAYVGDKHEDGIAADANSLPFFKASWGYGAGDTGEIGKHWQSLEKPSDLLLALATVPICRQPA